MKSLLTVICVITLFFCAQVKAQTLLDATQDQTSKKFTYKLGVKSNGRTDAFISGDWLPYTTDKNGKPTWSRTTPTIEGDMYVFTIETYDRPIAFYYDFETKSGNVLLAKEPHYKSKKNGGDGVIRSYLAGGKLYTLEEYTPTDPGLYGDKVVRWEWVGNLYKLYFNLNHLESDTEKPFATTSANGWEQEDLTILGSNGWAFMNVDPKNNDFVLSRIIGAGYGARKKSSSEESWANIGLSTAYFNQELQNLNIPILEK